VFLGATILSPSLRRLDKDMVNILSMFLLVGIKLRKNIEDRDVNITDPATRVFFLWLWEIVK